MPPADDLELDSGANKKAKLPLLIGIIVLLMGASIGGTLYFSGALNKKAAGPQLPPEPQYLSLGQEFIVNFQDSRVARYLQLGLDVSAHNEHVLGKITENLPAIRNDILLLLSGQKYDELRVKAGKDKLRTELLDVVQKSLELKKGEDGVDAIYFTQFMMQ